jgi:hypothetical protein
MSCEAAVSACTQLSASFIEINSQDTQTFVEEILDDEMDIYYGFFCTHITPFL